MAWIESRVMPVSAEAISGS